MVTLMEFIAAIPCSAGMREKAVMMKVEKAKKMPATRPLPMAAATRHMTRTNCMSKLLLEKTREILSFAK
jgi:hypothetical protein